jgi:RNA polymerase sigma factor (sigma-70 family)
MPSPSLAILRVQSDERLVALARAGHERPFEAIVERYRRPLLRHARRVVGEARAEDVVQQALVAAWAALQRGDDVRELRAWLHRIIHNTALNALRGQREHAELHDSFTTGGAPQDVLERRLIVRETLETLAALPERQREALLRTAIEGRSHADVARDLGLSDGAVRQLIHRARTAVRAAATALTPLPAANWLAAAGTRGEPMSDRLAELVGAAGAAGAGATLAKAGTIAVLAGGAAAGPALVERGEPPAAPAAAQAPRPARGPAPAGDRAAPVPIAIRAPAPRTASRGHGSDSSGPGSGRRDDGDTSGTGGPASRGADSDSSGMSGSGSSRSGSSGSGSSGSGSGSSESSGSSGSSGSGSGSGSSGSGTSGSGTSGSGSSGSGSGSSGSGASGSGMSGSGTSGSGSSGSGSGSSGSGSDTAIYGLETSGSGSGSSGSPGSDPASGSSGSGSGSSGSGSGDSEPDDVESP